ncbi:MAG: CGNR zinc finger domain-containing protein [Bradyrhizobiaceae bacterium]|nr:CGNR zinc finger domain-containing protein [Hyphomicrobiales bacterium]MBV9428946.1 CGNR zinc finger domain-containing protein [Bradyrhizobiaceae bacterium]
MPPGPSTAPSRAASLALVGGAPAFDLANTQSGRDGPRAQDHLRAPEHVVAWAHHAGILSEAGTRALRRSMGRPRVAAALLKQTRELRDLLYGIGATLAAGATPRADALDRLARIHARALVHARLAPSDGGLAWRWDAARTPVEAVVGPIALSAIGLVTGGERARIKQCAGDHCGWLFLDTTKNNRRRWCEMEVCGNRAKQKRLRLRRTEDR